MNETKIIGSKELEDKKYGYNVEIYQLEEGKVKMSIDTLFVLMKVLDTDANNLLGIDEKRNSIDAELNKLDPKTREKMASLFETMIKQAEESKFF